MQNFPNLTPEKVKENLEKTKDLVKVLKELVKLICKDNIFILNLKW